MVFQIVTAAPQKFKIDILPVDDGTPRIVTNLGLQWLEYMENKVEVFLSQHQLLMDRSSLLCSFMRMFNSCKGSNGARDEALFH